MNYTNGLDKEAFMQHMFQEFSVFENPFAREMLENIVDYGLKYHTTTKNGLYYFLKDMIPEVEMADLVPFMDKRMLTDEVLREAGYWRIDFTTAYHECHISVDGNVVYAFDVDSDNFADIDSDGLKDFVEECIQAMVEESEYGAGYSFSDGELDVLKGMMFDQWKYNYGIEDKSVDDLIAEVEHNLDKREPVVVQTLEGLKDFLEHHGCYVYDNGTKWSLFISSPAGEDLYFKIIHDGDIGKAIWGVKQLAADFDVDSHVANLVEAFNNGNYHSTRFSGLPNEQELKEDAKAIQQMLKALADGVDIDEKTVDGRQLVQSVMAKIKEASEKADKENELPDYARKGAERILNDLKENGREW